MTRGTHVVVMISVLSENQILITATKSSLPRHRGRGGGVGGGDRETSASRVETICSKSLSSNSAAKHFPQCALSCLP